MRIPGVAIAEASDDGITIHDIYPCDIDGIQEAKYQFIEKVIKLNPEIMPNEIMKAKELGFYQFKNTMLVCQVVQ
jgi:hypothetical protein